MFFSKYFTIIIRLKKSSQFINGSFMAPVFILACMFIFPLTLHADESDESRVIMYIKDKSGQQVGLYEKSYALLIGVSDYSGGWSKLPGVEKDVEAVKMALEKHKFHVEVIRNPNSVQLDQAFTNFINRYGRKHNNNRLLFYFAGHGYTVTQSYGGEMGYILPSDAPKQKRRPQEFLAKAMDMQMVDVYARRIQSKHALFVFDSCFSGSVFRGEAPIPTSITYKTAMPVRQFITSGGADERVPDDSIFCKQFIAGLNGDADSNNDGYVTGSELGEFLITTVINYSNDSQHPHCAKIRDGRLDKGDFVFQVKKRESPGLR